MFGAERLVKIREMLLEYKHVDVTTLSSIMSVSEATIRRDLEKLEEEGFLKKTHGGAIISEDLTTEVQLSYVNEPYIHEKKHIGMIAAQMINDGDTIFIGSGVTCLQIANEIKGKKDLTVVTNNINIILELLGSSCINVLLVGGNIELQGSSITSVGQYAKRMLENLFVNKAFFTVDGVSLKFGYTVNSIEEIEIFNILRRNADEAIVVADYTKFDKRSLTPFAPIDTFKTIITNAQINLEYKKYFFDNNIKLFTAYDPEKGII